MLIFLKTLFCGYVPTAEENQLACEMDHNRRIEKATRKVVAVVKRQICKMYRCHISTKMIYLEDYGIFLDRLDFGEVADNVNKELYSLGYKLSWLYSPDCSRASKCLIRGKEEK